MLRGNAEESSNTGPHLFAVRSDFGTFADNRHVDITDCASNQTHVFRCRLNKKMGSGSLPLRIAWRKMLPNISGSDSAQERARLSVQRHVRIGMPDQRQVTGNADAT